MEKPTTISDPRRRAGGIDRDAAGALVDAESAGRNGRRVGWSRDVPLGAAALYSGAGLLSGGLIVLSGLLPWTRRGPGSSLLGIEMAAALRGDVELGASASRAGLAIVGVVAIGVLHLASAATAGRTVPVLRGVSGLVVAMVLILFQRELGSSASAAGEIVGACAVLISLAVAIVAILRVRTATPGGVDTRTSNPSTRRVWVAACAVATVLSTGVLGYAYRYGAGRPGGDSPTAAVAKFFGAVNDGDALVLATSVVPSEAEQAGALVASLGERLGVDDVGTWGGSESEFEVSVDVTSLRVADSTADTAEIEVDGSLRASGLQLPGPLAVVLGRNLEIDLDQLGPRNNTDGTDGLVVTVRRHHDRWYVSPLIVADQLQEYLLAASSLLVNDARDTAQDLLQHLERSAASQPNVTSGARSERSAGAPRAELISAHPFSTRFTDGQLPHS